ncbi:MAG: hypothetical protein ACT4PP_08795 [Sporichthyaceae bacterium]
MNDRVRCIGIGDGAEYEIDVDTFAEHQPLFAYVDDVGSVVQPLRRLAAVGSVVIPDRPQFRWLDAGDRRCVLLQAHRMCRPSVERDPVAARMPATLLSLGVGEFCLEIYHVRADGSADLLLQDDWCFK